MNRSLFVGLRRLLSLKLYWIVLLGGVLIYAGYASSEPNTFDISRYTLFLFCPVAVISSLFTAYLVGTDYTDGMLRNRLIIGCERWRVYLSWMVVGLIGAFIIYFFGFMITLAIGLSKDHAFPMETKLYLVRFGIGFLVLTAQVALSLIVSVLAGKRNKALIWCVFLNVVMVLAVYALKNLVGVIGIGTDAYDRFLLAFSKLFFHGTSFGQMLLIWLDYGANGYHGDLQEIMDIRPTVDVITMISFIGIVTAVGILIFRRKDIE